MKEIRVIIISGLVSFHKNTKAKQDNAKVTFNFYYE